MSLLTILLIAIGLSMDAFAVSITSGIAIKDLKIRNALKIALFFGLFQAIMPVIGWLSGITLRGFISGIDHWVAFALLSAIGVKMICESFQNEKKKKDSKPLDLRVLLLLSIATSIDAFAVGITLSLLSSSIIMPVVIIGCITFLLSFAGVFIGNMAGHFFEKKMELAGGVTLILIGIKVLVDHL